MKLNNLRIVIDDREKKSGIPDLLKAVGVNVEIKTLPIGDYIVAPETVVERKSIKDLMSSIFDGRLFDQCSRLKEHFQFPIILIEGDVDEIDEIAVDYEVPKPIGYSSLPEPNLIKNKKAKNVYGRADSFKIKKKERLYT